MSGQIHTKFQSSLRVTSAPTSSGRLKSANSNKKPLKEFDLGIPLTDRSNSSTGVRSSKTPRPAWSQVQPKFSSSKKTPKSATPKPKPKVTEDFSRTKMIRKELSPRISVSKSFHIKNPDLIDSIVATGNRSRSPSLKSNRSKRKPDYESEFDRRDHSAAIIQDWWRKKQAEYKNDKKSFVIDRDKVDKPQLDYANDSSINTSIDILSNLTSMSSQFRESKVEWAKYPDQISTPVYKPMKSERSYRNVKASPRKTKTTEQTLRSERVEENCKKIAFKEPSNKNEIPKSSRLSRRSPRTNDIKTTAKFLGTGEDENLKSLMNIIHELEKPVAPKTTQYSELSKADLKLAELQASLREIEAADQLKKDYAKIDTIQIKSEENTKMLDQMFDEKTLQIERVESQVTILHNALKTQKEEHLKQIKEIELRFIEERRQIGENNSTQNNRQLGFIDQLIKDKQQLAEQLTTLAKKVEKGELQRKKEMDELKTKHSVELEQIKHKLTAAEKIRREKWIEVKQKEIKALTVKGLEPEIARLITRHKQELRNLKGEHEAMLITTDERASRRWADQAERMRQAFEEEKIKIAEAERERAREKIEKEFSNIEADASVTRERLNQERIIEKERQQQHMEYLKETNENRIAALTARHEENLRSLNEEWQLKFDDVIERTALEIKMEKEGFTQKVEKIKVTTERDNSEKLAKLNAELREQVKIERDKEIERAVNRIEEEMEDVRYRAEQTSNNKIERIQEKMKTEIVAAEKSETDMQRKYAEAKTKTNQVTEELIAEKHKNNLLTSDLDEKRERLTKLTSERERISDVIREEFADRIVKAETDLEEYKLKMAESEIKYKTEYEKLKRSREEELSALNERVRSALTQRDEQIARTNEEAQQAKRRADYMEEMLDKQNKLLREKNTIKR